jgi:uncharacterized protein (TIGR03086 family)
MTEPEVFTLADNALNGVVQQIKDDQWEMKMPKEFLRKGMTEITLREIINYHAYDDIWVPETLAGKTIEEVGKKHDGDLLGQDPKASFAAIVQKAVAAAQAVADLDKMVHLTYGDYPTREYFWHITMFRGTRAYDIAKLIGVESPLTDELAQGLYDQIAPHAEEWRKMGLFQAPVEVGADASIQDKLLGITGRQPS